MITPTMNIEERILEIQKELGDPSFILKSQKCYQDYIRYAHQKRSRVPFRKRKTTLMMFPKQYRFTSKRKNRWLLCFRSTKKTVIYRLVCRYETATGFMACHVKDVPIVRKKPMPFLVEYTTHFFRRYTERHQLADRPLREQVEHFFLNNPDLEIFSIDDKELSEEKEPIGIYYVHGVGLGSIFVFSTLIRMNTYLPYSYTENGSGRQQRFTEKFDSTVFNVDLADPEMGERHKEYLKMMKAAQDKRGVSWD